MKTQLSLLLIASALGVSFIGVRAQGTAFTYQGRLSDGAGPASGVYDLRFTIYDSTNNPGVLVAGPITNSATSVSNGLFTATLDFGPGVFDGAPRFLEIAVRTNGGVSFAVLAPRQALTPSPYAIFANTASNLAGTLPSGDLSGPYSSPVQFNNGSDVFDGTFNGQFFGSTFTGGIFTGNFLGSGSGLSDVWHTTGNMGTTPANFLGTTDNQPLFLKVNGQEVMRYEPSPETPNIVGGWSGNRVQPGLQGVTIAGGGSMTSYQGQVQANVVTNNGFYAVVAGGYHNMVTNYGGTILGGSVNLSGGNFATILGGQFHTNAGNYSVVAGGFNNSIYFSDDSVIGGGYQNNIYSNWSGATIAGGVFQVIQTNASFSFIGGGYGNIMNGYLGAIVGGWANSEDSYAGTIGGGLFNTVQSNSDYSFIGGGYANGIGTNAGNSVIGGGLFNNIYSNADQSVIGGGNANTIEGQARESFIGSGFANDLQPGAFTSFVGGGHHNTNAAAIALIGGGQYNSIGLNSSDATIGGGGYNSIQPGAFSSTIGGGYGNTIQGGAFNSIIGGGFTNTISSNALDVTISGGSFNTVGPAANLSTISGGTGHQVNGAYSFVGGGIANTADGFLSTSVGGQGNAAFFNNTTIVGGLFNTNYGVLSFIGGGDNNLSIGYGSVISGGESNRTGGFFSMASGYHAGALHNGTFVWSDYEPANFSSTSSNQFLIRAQNGVGINTNNPQAALHVVGTIIADNFSGSGSTLSGLNFSQLTGTLLDGQLTGTYSSAVTLNNVGNSFAGNGSSLTALNASQLTSGTVPNGALSGTYSSALTLNNVGNSFTGNGAGLTALNASSLGSGTVPDGRLSSNVALLNRDPQTFAGQNSFNGNIVMTDPTKSISFPATSGANAPMITMFASGVANADRMVIAHSSAFSNYGLQYQDSTDRFYFIGNGINAMTIDLVSHSVGVGTNNPQAALHVIGNILASGTITGSSDRNVKENFASVDAREVLDKVAALPITRWNYKADAGVMHLGPMAQDFHAAFDVGMDDKHISMVDADGVALAAIQGLNQKVEEQRGELKQKETEIAELKQRLEKLERFMSRQDGELK